MPKLKIKELRTKSGISQGELATKMNVAQATLSNWENDIFEPDVKAFKKLSQIFKVSVDYKIENDIIFEDV